MKALAAVVAIIDLAVAIVVEILAWG